MIYLLLIPPESGFWVSTVHLHLNSTVIVWIRTLKILLVEFERNSTIISTVLERRHFLMISSLQLNSTVLVCKFTKIFSTVISAFSTVFLLITAGSTNGFSTKKKCPNTKSVSVVQFFKLFWILVAVLLREFAILNNLSSKFIVVF